jgi:hypothetical protein
MEPTGDGQTPSLAKGERYLGHVRREERECPFLRPLGGQ